MVVSIVVDLYLWTLERMARRGVALFFAVVVVVVVVEGVGGLIGLWLLEVGGLLDLEDG